MVLGELLWAYGSSMNTLKFKTLVHTKETEIQNNNGKLGLLQEHKKHSEIQIKGKCYRPWLISIQPHTLLHVTSKNI